MAWIKGGGCNGPVGTRVRVGRAGKVQRVRSEGRHWTDEAEQIFFDSLADSSNVKLSASMAGFSTPTVYRLKRERPGFAEKWKAALEQGYDRLEMALVELATSTVKGEAIGTDNPLPPMTIEQAMNILRAHGHEVAGKGRRGPGRGGKLPKLDDVRASILRKIEAIERAEKKQKPRRQA